MRAGTTRTVGGHVESRGSAYAPFVVSMSDPVSMAGSSSAGRPPGTARPTARASAYSATGTWRIETANGAWQGSNTRVEADGVSDKATAALVGEGDYQGLFAVREQTIDSSGWDVQGIDLPGRPSPAATLP